LILLSLSILLVSSIATATSPDYEDYPPWYWFVGGADLPETGNCNGSIISDISPYDGEYDVTVDEKGVLVCANITPPQGCNISVQFQWLNYTHYYADFFIWCDIQPWGDYWDWDEWIDDIDWQSLPDCYNDTYWENFSSITENINQSTELCFYAENASCSIENDFTTEYFDWRINWSINCSGNITTGNCYYYFEPEICPVIQYIYPPSPNGTICPCCDTMCISVNNTEGHPMNITFYRNDTQFPDYYIVNQYTNVTNGTYCFCIDGHLNNSIYYPMNFNEIYHWYVNITDTVDSDYLESDIFTFRTYPDTSWCPCGPEELIDLIEDTDTIKDDSWIVGLFILTIGLVFVLNRRR